MASTASSLSVSFQHLLPSEELLHFARSLWAEMADPSLSAGRAATLTIAKQVRRGEERFLAHIAVPELGRFGAEIDGKDPFMAVGSAFARLGEPRQRTRSAM
jgi:hypothetical protein